MKMITIEGAIGVGKSSLAKILGERYGGIVKLERTDSELLELWYKLTKSERQEMRVPFHTQVEFLNRRHNMILECMLDKKQGLAILDRSIFTDTLFARLKYQEGEINELEWNSYNNIRDMALREIESLPQKAPHLTIYINAPFEVAEQRIAKRGRDIEVNADDSMKCWFKTLHKKYHEFMVKEYNHSEVLVIDGSRDFAEDKEYLKEVLDIIDTKLKELNLI